MDCEIISPSPYIIFNDCNFLRYVDKLFSIFFVENFVNPKKLRNIVVENEVDYTLFYLSA